MNWYIRCQTSLPARHASWPLGIFHGAPTLREIVQSEESSAGWIEEVFDWFNDHLPVPPYDEIDPRAVFWFRPDARHCVAEAWKLTAAYRQVGICARLHRTNRPGRIIYRDKHQIAAIPYWPFDRGPPFDHHNQASSLLWWIGLRDDRSERLHRAAHRDVVKRTPPVHTFRKPLKLQYAATR